MLHRLSKHVPSAMKKNNIYILKKKSDQDKNGLTVSIPASRSVSNTVASSFAKCLHYSPSKFFHCYHTEWRIPAFYLMDHLCLLQETFRNRLLPFYGHIWALQISYRSFLTNCGGEFLLLVNYCAPPTCPFLVYHMRTNLLKSWPEATQ